MDGAFACRSGVDIALGVSGRSRICRRSFNIGYAAFGVPYDEERGAYRRRYRFAGDNHGCGNAKRIPPRIYGISHNSALYGIISMFISSLYR